jgi:hypothetical protein
MNIETMTPAERIKLLEALELSFGVVAVAHVDIEDARDRLQKLEPDAQRASIDLIRRAAQEVSDEARLSEAGCDAVVAWARKRLTWE